MTFMGGNVMEKIIEAMIGTRDQLEWEIRHGDKNQAS